MLLAFLFNLFTVQLGINNISTDLVSPYLRLTSDQLQPSGCNWSLVSGWLQLVACCRMVAIGRLLHDGCNWSLVTGWLQTICFINISHQYYANLASCGFDVWKHPLTMQIIYINNNIKNIT